MSNLDNILDATLDDLADMPSIVPFPDGAHKVTLSFKFDDKKAAVMLQLTYVEALEIPDTDAAIPAAGDKNTVYYGLKTKEGKPNEYAQGALKLVLLSLKESFPGNSMKEIMASAEGAEVAVVTKIRLGKGEYEGKDNIDIQKIQII